MYQTLAQMRADLMGMVPGFNKLTYNAAIQRAYDDIARGYPWQDLEVEVNVATVAGIEVGGVHCVNGSTQVTAATSVSAAWTLGESDGFAGRFFKKGDDSGYFIISGSDSVELTLDSAYIGKTTTAVASAGDGYLIFKHIYTIDSGVETIQAVMCEDHYLREMTDEKMDRFDTDFDHGSDEPSRWRNMGRNSAGVSRIQLYPANIDDVYVLRVRGRKRIETLTDTTKPLLDSTLIIAFAEVELLRRKKLLDPNSVTDSMIDERVNNAANQFNYSAELDRRSTTDQKHVKDAMFGESTHRGQKWYVTHDPWDA